jgi:hypothetical protein
MNWILRFVSQDVRDLITLGQRIASALDTPEERRAAIKHGIDMLSPDSEGGTRATVSEWAKWGSLLGVLRAPNRKKKQ